MEMARKLKICLACSAGGHLRELTQLLGAVEGHDTFFLTFRREDSEELDGRVYFVSDPKRDPLKLLKNVIQSARVILKERPDVVMTTGAGVAVPACYLGKLLGAKVVYIESLTRIDRSSLSGRAVYPIADLFFVQWRSLLSEYGKKAQYGGAVI